MKLTLLAAISLLTLASCGPGKTGGDSAPVPEPSASVLSKFAESTPGTALHGIATLDFSQFSLNVPVDVSGNCNGTSFGNVGNVNGVPQGFAEIQGDEQSGVIQYGHLNYLNPLDQLCKDLSKEGYNYSISGKKLTLCMVNYPFCADYTLVE